MNPPTRRSFLRRMRNFALAPVLVGGGAYSYGYALERHRLVVEQHPLSLALGEKGPHKLRAVALSDFHFDPLCEADFAQRYVDMANGLEPDVVFLTGDFISHRNRRFAELAEVLGGLKARHGVFACLGNHDHRENPAEIVNTLKQRGIETLVNQRTGFACNGGQLIVAGLQSAWGGMPNWGMASNGLRHDERALVLMHEPDFARWLSSDPRIALQVSGHTHGGQIRIPGFGAMRLPRWGLRYTDGFFDLNDMKLYVSRGVGTVHLHVRFLCPPEVTCFDITNSSLPA